jgi:hypothetical protein
VTWGPTTAGNHSVTWGPTTAGNHSVTWDPTTIGNPSVTRSHNVTWDRNAITFTTSANLAGNTLIALHVDQNDNVFVYDSARSIFIWPGSNNTASPRVIPTNAGLPSNIFVLNNSDILVSTSFPERRITRWTAGGSLLQWSIPLWVPCDYLFIGTGDALYCSESSYHQVTRIALNQSIKSSRVIAGTGCAGSGISMIWAPRGIFVSDSQDLYVADCGNDRVQLFRSGQLNGTTVAGNGAPNTIALDCPTDVILDANEYLFISDLHYHRVVGSGPYGFRCIVGCWGGPSSGSAYLYYPMGISFDRLGNLYVADQYNHRIQKFNTLNNSCSECTS